MTASPSAAPDAATASAAWQEFRARRDRSLAAPHGVLAQVGLHWVDPDAGQQTFEGLPGAWRLVEDRLEVSWEGDAVELLVDPAQVEVTAEGGRRQALLLAPGDVRLADVGEDVQVDVIRRGGRTGLRVLDPAAPRRTGFSAVPTYPHAPEFVLTGTFRAEPSEVTVGSALPWLEQQLPSPGIVNVEIDGESVELVLTGESSLLFTDETSGTDSADWRVVGVELDGDSARIDLHRAVNFPAAFSSWATCPRPPAGNHLPVEVRAGEKRVPRTDR